jgi:hypothetical protein
MRLTARNRDGKRQTTLVNFLAEAPSEDIIPYGDVLDNKADGVWRIGFQNVHGTHLQPQMAGMEETDAMLSMQIDTLGLAETNLSWTQDNKMILKSLIDIAFGYTGRCVAASCPSERLYYQPGGTAMIARGANAGRIHEQGSDEFGSFTWSAYRGREGQGVLLFSAYRVCQKKSTRAGVDTLKTQQYVAMREAGDKSPDPRNNIFRRMSDIISKWEQRGYHPIVMIDANSDLDDGPMREFIIRHNLKDVIGEYHSATQGPPPRTFQWSNNRLDYILSDDYVFNTVMGCGACGLQDAMHSDHTMQWVDLDIRKLFRNKAYEPVCRFSREFRLSNVIKKRAFQEKLTEIYIHQKFCERVKEMTEEFDELGAIPLLVDKYQRLDYEMVCAFKAAANSVGRPDFGYQRSPDLVKAGRTISLWRFILQSISAGYRYSQKIHDLAEHLELMPNEYMDVSEKYARKQLATARRIQKQVFKEESDRRQNWLEELADEIAMSNPNSNKEAVLRQMINQSRTTAIHRKLSTFFKPNDGAIKMTKIPQREWYYDSEVDELYQFHDGVFRAYPSVGALCPDDQRVFESHFEFKKPPNHIYHVEVDVTANNISITHHHNLEQLSWTEVTESGELEEWFIRRNKAHLQQMWTDGSFPTSPDFRPFLEDYGTGETVQELLNGEFNIDQSNFTDEVKEVLRVFQRTDKERELTIERRLMTASEFQSSFKVAKEKTSSSPSGLHYGLWKAAAEIDDLATTHAQMTSLPFMYGFTCERW